MTGAGAGGGASDVGEDGFTLEQAAALERRWRKRHRVGMSPERGQGRLPDDECVDRVWKMNF